MANQSFDEVLQLYITAAMLHGEATMKGDYKTANKQYKKLEKIYKRLEKDHVLAANLLEILFRHVDASVRMWASAHALDLNIRTDDAVRILEQNSKDQSIGILRVSSEKTISEWKRKGGLKFS